MEHRVPGVLHRVLGVLHRVLGVLHRVLGVLHRVRATSMPTHDQRLMATRPEKYRMWGYYTGY